MASSPDGIDPSGVNKVLRLLEALQRSPGGNVLYRQIEHLLDDVAVSQQTIERAYTAAINQLLDAYLRHLREGSPLQLQVRLLMARLQPPMTMADIATLRDYVDLYSRQIEAMSAIDPDIFEDAVRPLLESFGIVEPGSESGGRIHAEALLPALVPEAEDETGAEASAEIPAPETPATAEPPPEQAGTDVDQAVASESAAHGKLSAVNDSGVRDAAEADESETRDEVESYQSNLNQQLQETIAQNAEFGVLLEVVHGELHQAGDRAAIEDLRWTMIRETERLLKSQHKLASRLDSTYRYLHQLETDSQQLSDELSRVRLLSMTDELTGLPNRRAFLRRLEDEVARVQRYGFPLSLVLIDLDYFKQINDKYGHGGGDEVLKIYAKNILSIFRHHDLVARYGGEEFAVLLPNTDVEGSSRALNKVRNRALETRWQLNGEYYDVPTFSGGVSLYKPGETASSFIERADKALYRAKRMGRNRVELDMTYSGEPPKTESADTDAEKSERTPRQRR
jgi:diguanylate cyclase (GGDEF)-like protein